MIFITKFSVSTEAYVIVDANSKEAVNDLKEEAPAPLSPTLRKMHISPLPQFEEIVGVYRLNNARVDLVPLRVKSFDHLRPMKLNHFRVYKFDDNLKSTWMAQKSLILMN